MSKKRYVKKNKSIIMGLVCALLAVGAVGALGAVTKGFQEWNVNNWFEKTEEDKTDSEITIEEKGISVKSLKTVNNDDGTVSKVFSYSVTPTTATNQAIFISAKYEDNTNCDAALTTSVDLSKKEVTLNCLNDFGKKIKVTLVSLADSTKTAVVTVDYTKKVKTAGYNNSPFYLSLEEENEINYDDYVDIVYSQYTIDKLYTVKFNSLSLDIGEYSVVTDFTLEQMEMMNIGIAEYVEHLMSNPSVPISQDFVWNEFNDNAWHSFLVSNVGEGSYFSYKINSLVLDVVNSDNEVQKQITISDQFIKVYLDCNWSGYEVLVDGISSELTNVVF